MPHYLTKSRFKLALECPTKLYYTNKKDEYADERLDDAFLAALAEGGFQVAELARPCVRVDEIVLAGQRTLNEFGALDDVKRDARVLGEMTSGDRNHAGIGVDRIKA